MTKPLTIHTQVLGSTVLVTLCGTFLTADSSELRAALSGLPPGIRTVVLDVEYMRDMSGDAIFFGLIHDFAVVRAAYLVTIGLKVYKRSGPALEHAHFVPSAMAGEREHEAPEAFRRRLNARSLAQQAAGIRVAR